MELNFGWTVHYCPIAKRLRHEVLNLIFVGSNPTRVAAEKHIKEGRQVFLWTGKEKP